MEVSQCPSMDQWREMLDEGGGDTDRSPLFDHLEGCAACREALDRMTEQTSEWTSWRALLRDPRVSWPDPLDEAPAQTAQEGLPEIPGYEILEKIGQGGMGVVYKARHKTLGRIVALKFLRDHRLDDPHLRRRFRQEAALAARLQHPNIVQVFDYNTFDEEAYISCEFVEGGTLAERLREQLLTAQEAARLTEVLARGIQAAHEANVLHRDLKPANILLAKPNPRVQLVGEAETIVLNGETLIPKLADFGLARAQEQSQLTHGSVVMGTPSYMPPEQARSEPFWSSVAVDIYGLGAILYESVTGRPPFRASTALETLRLVTETEPVRPRVLQPQLPMDLETICLKCLRKNPIDRYASADELAEDLRCFLNHQPIHAKPVTRLRRAILWTRRHPIMALLILACSVLGLGLVATMAAFLVSMQSKNKELAKLNFDLMTQAELVRKQEQTNKEQQQQLQRQKQALDHSLKSMAATLSAYSEVIRTDRRFFIDEDQEFRKRIMYKTLEAQTQLVALMKDNDDLLLEQARALHSMSGLSQSLGQSDQAARYAKQAIASWERWEFLAARVDPSSKHLLEAGVCRMDLGNALMSLQSHQEAIRWYQEAIEYLIRYQPSEPRQRAETLIILAEANNHVATLLIHHDPQGLSQVAKYLSAARQAIRQSQDLEPLPRAVFSLAQTELHEGTVAANTGAADKARRHYLNAVHILEDASAEPVRQFTKVKLQAWAYRDLGLWHRRHGPPEETFQWMSKSINQWSLLLAGNPQHAPYRFELAGQRGVLGECFFKKQQFKEAAQNYHMALSDALIISRAFPHQWSYVQLLAQLCLVVRRDREALGISLADIPLVDAASFLEPFAAPGPYAEAAGKLLKELQKK